MDAQKKEARFKRFFLVCIFVVMHGLNIPIIWSHCSEGRSCMISNRTFHYLAIPYRLWPHVFFVEMATTTIYSDLFPSVDVHSTNTFFSLTVATRTHNIPQHAFLSQAFSMLASWSTGSWQRYPYSYNSFFHCAARLKPLGRGPWLHCTWLLQEVGLRRFPEILKWHIQCWLFFLGVLFDEVEMLHATLDFEDLTFA